jgi:general stress protein 26
MTETKHIRDYEDVTVYGLSNEREQQLIDEQNECTFVWNTADGSSMAVIMSYFRTPDGVFWMTASGQRKRIPAIRRDPRVVVVVTSSGTSMRAGKTVTYKGIATVHDDDETKQWFYPLLAERLMAKYGQSRVDEFAKMLDSPRRVVVSIEPGLRVGYDGDRMHDATTQSRQAGALNWES